MTLTGRLDQAIGSNALISQYDVWQIVGTVDRANLGNTARTYAFWIHCLIGNLGISTTATNTVVEVALAEVDATGAVVAVSMREIQRFQFADQRLWALSKVRQMVAAEFLLVLDGALSHPTWGTTWPSNRSLALVARINANGDPPGGNGQAFVADWQFVTWDLEALGSSRWYHAEYQPAQPQAFNAPGTPRYFTMAHGGAALGATSETWLVFWSSTYRPWRAVGASPDLTLFLSPDGIAGNEQEIFKVGSNGRLLGDFAGRWCQFAHGAFAVVVLANGVSTLGISGEDRYTAGGAGLPPSQTWVVGSSVFAVRLRDAASVDDLYHVQYETSANEYDVIDELARPNGRYLPWAPSNPPGASNWAILACCAVNSFNASSSVPNSYSQLLHGEGFSPRLALTWGMAQMAEPLDRIPQVLALEASYGVNATVRQYEFDWWHGVHGPFLANPDRDVRRWTVVGFGFEDDPSNVPALDPDVPASIILIPNRESLDPGSLSALPREPAADYHEEAETAEADWRSPTGYRWPLPRFAKGRRTFDLHFPGLTAAELAADLAFYDANPFVKWTPKSEAAALPFLVVKKPEGKPDSPRHWTLSLQLLELVFTGPPS